MKQIQPVILSGGSGARLWPYSREAHPKQFLQLIGEGTLFQQTCRRVSGPLYAPPIILCNAEHRFLAAEQMQSIGADAAEIVLEPAARNTAPAALTAALLVARSDPDTLIVLLPSDHVVVDEAGFTSSVELGIEAAEKGNMVVFGVRPDRPETGFGYIRSAGTDGEVLPVAGFTEKPSQAKAERYLREGGYYWNTGVFLFSAKAMIEAFKEYAPEFEDPCRRALRNAVRDLDFLRLEKSAFEQCAGTSLDYAIIEKAQKIKCVPLQSDWNDLGAWHSVWDTMEKDGNGNASRGDVVFESTRNSYACSMDGACLSVLGLDGVVAVCTKDAVLLASKDHAQDVKKLVGQLKSQGKPQAVSHARVYRPWGWYEQLSEGLRHQVKRLMVKPGAKLSLQSHRHRAEHWVVVSGTARVTNGDTVSVLAENQSTYIPVGNLHRLENTGLKPALLIEVQSGSYLGEDDIVRYDDTYGRARL